MGKSLIFLGVILIAAGILISIGGKIPFMGICQGISILSQVIQKYIFPG